MNSYRCALTVFAVLFLATSHLVGENWPNWRGPAGDNIAPGEGYPLSWGEEENIAWKVKLPGWGTSTPAIWGNHIFVSCADEESKKNLLVCLDRQGNRRWQAELGDMVQSRNRKASGANPSPVTDGQHVFTYYKSGDLGCVNFAGDIVWEVNLQKEYGRDNLNWDLGTSPVLTRDFVVIAVMHAGPSYVVARKKSTGEVAWKQDRDLGAPREARDSYSTPVVIERDGQEYLVVLGADHVTVHEAGSGKEVWRVGELNPSRRANFRSIASPTVTGDIVLAPYARGATLTSMTWPMSPSKVAPINWTARDSADVPCPVAFQGNVYVCGDRGDVVCIDLQSGEQVWAERLPRNRYVYSSSPVIAEGKLYATREDGTTFVLELGDTPKLLSTNVLRENTFATPAFVDGQIFMRTSDYLFCIDDGA